MPSPHPGLSYREFPSPLSQRVLPVLREGEQEVSAQEMRMPARTLTRAAAPQLHARGLNKNPAPG